MKEKSKIDLTPPAMPMQIGSQTWPLVRRGGFIVGQSPEGQEPKDSKEIDRWQRGPKVWSYKQMLEFDGFRTWVTVAEKANPKLFDGAKRGEQFTPGHVLEIVDRTHARFERAGILAVEITVERVANAPLSVEDTQKAGAIIGWLEGKNELPESELQTGETIRQLTEETRRINERAEQALRHATDCQAAARKAEEYPEAVAIEMGDIVRDKLDDEPRKILQALEQTGGHRDKSARIAKVSQAKVSRCIFNTLRPAFAEAGHKVLPRYLMTKQELKAHRFDANAPGATDGNKRIQNKAKP